MKIVNLTNHEVNIVDGNYNVIKTFPSEGIVRCSSNTKMMPSIEGVPISITTYGDAENVPKKEKDTIYIVSKLVAQVHRDRNDFYIVDRTVRNNVSGIIIGAKGLSLNPFYINSITEFMKNFEDIIEDYIDMSLTEDEAVEIIFDDELNYNNADKTSGQVVYTETEISSLLEDTVDKLKEEDDRCSSCGAKIKENDYSSVVEERPGVGVGETIVNGYKCSVCGEEESY